MTKIWVIVILSVLFITACQTTQPELSSDLAAQALKDFYALLHQGLYTQAAQLYGGSYEVLIGYTPTIDPTDEASLLQAGCEFNGLMCLPVLTATSVDDDAGQDFIFSVEYLNSDGTPFILGPCCGETEEVMPPVSTFTVHVRCETADVCQVLDLPPYVP
jgi:hypothetical protein